MKSLNLSAKQTSYEISDCSYCRCTFASNPRVRKHLACIHVGKVQSHTFLIIFFDLFHPSCSLTFDFSDSIRPLERTKCRGDAGPEGRNDARTHPRNCLLLLLLGASHDAGKARTATSGSKNPVGRTNSFLLLI